MKTSASFSFKQKSQDFIVEEKLPFALAGKGDAFFVFFEKRNINTMDVVEHLCSSLKISRLTLGIAGLKDKKAMARQWISIYQSALKRMGGEVVFVNCLAEVAKILKTWWHNEPIDLRTPIENVFHIRLRAKKKLGREERSQAQQGIEKLFADGFPNFFGEQRFGINGRNWKQGMDLIAWKSDVREKKEIIFKLQSVGSKLFNDYLGLRVKKILDLMDGDIVSVTNEDGTKEFGVYRKKNHSIQTFHNPSWGQDFFCYPQQLGQEIPFDAQSMTVTGPVMGFNTLLCQTNTLAGKGEQAFLKQKQWDEKKLKLFRDCKVWGLRRDLWVWPVNKSVRYQWDDLLIRFALPSGSYASVLIDLMMGTLEG